MGFLGPLAVLAVRARCLVLRHCPERRTATVDRIQVGLTGERVHVVESILSCARCRVVLGRAVGCRGAA